MCVELSGRFRAQSDGRAPGPCGVWKTRVVGLALLASVACGRSALAQQGKENEDPDKRAAVEGAPSERKDTEEEIEEIVVTASRIERSAAEEPVSVHVISGEELDHAGTMTVGDALRWVLGVDISGGAPFAAASRSTALFQGLPAQYSLVLVDGQRTKSDHIHTGVNLELIPLSMIERIEVIRGPGSVVHGSDALGGIVNIITRPVPEDQALVLSTTYGSENTLDIGVLQGNSWERFGYAVTGSISSSDGVGTGNEYERGSARLRLHGEPFESLRTTLGLSYYEGEYATSNDSMAEYRLDVEGGGGETGRLKGILSYTDYDRVFRSGAATADNNVATGIVQYDRSLGGRNHLVAGMEWRGEEFERLATPRHRADVVSAYVQDEYAASGSLKAVLGLRADHYDVTGTELSPRGGMHWSGSSGDVRLSIAKGFRIPSLQDLHEVEFDHTTWWRNGNPDLKPETALHFSAEGQYDLPDSQTALRGFLFRNDITNMIALRYVGDHPVDGDPILQRENIKEAHTQGIEIGALSEPEAREGLAWRVSYAYLDAKDDTTDTVLAYSPKHSIKAGLSYRRRWFSVGVLAEGVLDRYYRDKNDNILPLDDYFLLDLNLGADITERIKASLSVKNLLDQEFETYEEGRAVASYGVFVALGLKAEF